MVKSEKLYSPQNYLEAVTGNCYIIRGDNDVEEIETILESLDYCLWSHALTEIDYIMEENLDVVLVDCMIWNEEKSELEHVYRWFEVPEDFEEEEE